MYVVPIKIILFFSNSGTWKYFYMWMEKGKKTVLCEKSILRLYIKKSPPKQDKQSEKYLSTLAKRTPSRSSAGPPVIHSNKKKNITFKSGIFLKFWLKRAQRQEWLSAKSQVRNIMYCNRLGITLYVSYNGARHVVDGDDDCYVIFVW